MNNIRYSLYRLVTHSREFIDDKNRQQRNNTIAAVLMTLLLGAFYLLGNGNLAIPLAPFLFIAILILLWNYPHLLLPITVGGACLFETQQYNFSDSLTDRVPLFWDVNTIFQQYAHVDFHGLPLSIFEIILIIGGVFGIMRAVYEKRLNTKGGALLAPIIAYLVCVSFGIANGLSTGGDYKIAMFEVRAQFYILIAYLIAMNHNTEPQDTARSTMWLAVICIGIKGLLLTIRYFVTLGGQTNADLGVGAHEESFFFNLFVMLYVTLKMANIEPKLRSCMLILMPFVLIANLANERRAATAANMVAIPVILFLSYAAFPHRRAFIAKLTVCLIVILAFYLPAYWRSDSVIAQPARAVRSHFDPDARDISSDAYRLAEDANLMGTMRVSPVIGYGYGKPMRVTTQMVDLSNIDPMILYLTHDQILWVWMRIGTVGFFVFWILICHFLIRSSQIAADIKLNQFVRSVGVFSTVAIVTLLFFGLYDLQLSNVRDMLFASAWMGVIASLVRQRDEELEYYRLMQMTEMQRRLRTGRYYPRGYRVANSNVHVTEDEPEPIAAKRALNAPETALVPRSPRASGRN